MAKLMVQDKRLELLRRRQRDLNPPCLPIPPILRLKVAFRSANHHLTNYFVITGVLSIGKPLAGNLAPVIFVRRAPWCNNAIQIRTVFVADSFLQSREGDGFCAFLVVEGDHHFIIVQENRIDEGVDEHLAMDLLPHVQLTETVEPEGHKLRADLGLRQLFAGRRSE